MISKLIQKIIICIDKHKQFPIFILPGAIIDVIAFSLNTYLISTCYGAIAIGEFSQAQRISSAPMALLSTSIANVFYINAHSQEKEHRLANYTKGFFTILITLGLINIIGSVALGQQVVDIFLGEDWGVNANIITLAGAAAIVRYCISPITSIFAITHKSSRSLRWQILYLTTTLGVLGVCAKIFSFSEYMVC